MLEPVRQYALGRLEESGETQETRPRHAALFLELAEKATPELQGPRQVEWLDRLERENDNLRAAMSWALAEREVATAARLGWALWMFWWFRGHQGEGRRWMEALLKGDLAPDLRTMALAVAGTMAYAQGDYEACERWLRGSLESARGTSDAVRAAHSVHDLGLLALGGPDLETARARLEEAVSLYLEAGGSGQMVSQARTQLGTILLIQGDRDQAATMMEEGLAMARLSGDRASTYIALYNLAQVALSRGDHDEAAALLGEGVALSGQMRDQANLAYFSEGLAVVAGVRREAERSARLIGVAEGLLEDTGAPVYNYYVADRSLYECTVEDVRSRLGEPAFEDEKAAGRVMGFEQAVAYALDHDRATRSP